MKRVMAVVLIAVLLWSVGVTIVARVYFAHWLWGTPLAALGGVVIAGLLSWWLRRWWIPPSYR